MIHFRGDNTKIINDPIFVSVKEWMKERLAYLKENGPKSWYDLSLIRYTGLTHKDVVIEPPVYFPETNKTLACFVSRKTGFLRADAEIKIVPFPDILKEFEVPVVDVADLADIIDRIKIQGLREAVIYNIHDYEYGIVIRAEKRTPEAIMKVMNDIYWDSVNIDVYPQMDQDTKKSAEVTIKTVNIEDRVLAVYFVEDILAIA